MSEGEKRKFKALPSGVKKEETKKNDIDSFNNPVASELPTNFVLLFLQPYKVEHSLLTMP